MLSSQYSERAARHLAKRRAGYLETNPQKMIKHDRYWSALVVKLVFDRAELLRLTEPSTAWEALRWLPRMIERVPIGLRFEEFDSAEEKIDQKIRALALLGETAGLTDHVGSAQRAFSEARLLLTTGKRVKAKIAAEYHQRLAAYALRMGQVDDAKELTHRALELFGENGPIAETLLLAGVAHGRDGLEFLARSLESKLDYSARKIESRVAAQAWALLVRDLYGCARSRSVIICSAVFEHLERVHPRTRRIRKVPAISLPWIAGLAAWGMCMTPLAERRLNRTHQVSLKRRDRRPAACIGVDLAEFRASEGEPQKAIELLKQTRKIVLEDLGDRQVADSLDVAIGLDPDDLRKTRELMVRRLPLEDLFAYPLGLAGHTPQALKLEFKPEPAGHETAAPEKL